MVHTNAHLITESLSLDLGRRNEESLTSEVWLIIDEINLAVKRLPEWVKDESCVRDTGLAFKLNRPRVRRQPKGVGLIIGPWVSLGGRAWEFRILLEWGS